MVHDLRRVILLIEKSRSFGRGLLRGIARYSDKHGPWIFQEIPPFYLYCLILFQLRNPKWRQ